MELKDIIELINKKMKKGYAKSILLYLILVIGIWLFIPKQDYKIKNIDLDIPIKISLTILPIIIFVIYYCIKIYKRKNRTKLPGIGFIISDSNLNEKNIEKELFFHDLFKETKDKFKIIVYDDIVLKNDNEYIKFLRKYNLILLLSIEEREANENNDKLYIITNDRIGYKFKTKHLNIPAVKIEIRNEIINSINRVIKIPNKNNNIDSQNFAKELKIEIEYIIGNIYALSSTPEKSLEYYKEIKSQISNTHKKELRYIKENLPNRILYSLELIILDIMDNQKYYSNYEILKKLEKKVNELESLTKKYYKNHFIPKNKAIAFMDGVYQTNAMISCERKDFFTARKWYQQLSPSNINTFIKKLDIAFIKAQEEDYKESYKQYLQLKNRKYINEYEKQLYINDAIKYIDLRLDENPKDEKLIFSYAILNYYFKDSFLGLKKLQELAKNNKIINDIYKDIISTQNKNIIKKQ